MLKTASSPGGLLARKGKNLLVFLQRAFVITPDRKVPAHEEMFIRLDIFFCPLCSFVPSGERTHFLRFFVSGKGAVVFILSSLPQKLADFHLYRRLFYERHTREGKEKSDRQYKNKCTSLSRFAFCPYLTSMRCDDMFDNGQTQSSSLDLI